MEEEQGDEQHQRGQQLKAENERPQSLSTQELRQAESGGGDIADVDRETGQCAHKTPETDCNLEMQQELEQCTYWD